MPYYLHASPEMSLCVSKVSNVPLKLFCMAVQQVITILPNQTSVQLTTSGLTGITYKVKIILPHGCPLTDC